MLQGRVTAHQLHHSRIIPIKKCISPLYSCAPPPSLVSHIFFRPTFPLTSMSLSVSSFPEAPPKLAHHPKWRNLPSPKGKSGFFGALLSKGSVPFLKHIRHFTKADVKESVIHQPVNVPSIQSRHPLSVSPSSIKAPSIVIDLRSVPTIGECFPSSKFDDVDASSLDPVLEISHSPQATPVALPFPSTTERISATPTLLSAKEHNEIAPVVDDSEPRDSRSNVPSVKSLAEPSRRWRATTSSASTAPPGFGATTSHSPTTPSPTVASTEGRPRLRSILTGVKQTATETESPRRPRHKSETSIGVRGATTPSSPNDTSREGKRTYRGKSSPPPLPSSMSSSAVSKQQYEMGAPWRPLSNASSKSVGGVKPSELPVPNQPARLTAHMLCMRSGSRPLPTHLTLSSGRMVARPRSKTSDAASAPYRPRTTSASLAVRTAECEQSQQSPPPPPTPGLPDGGRRSRLPVPSAPAASRLETTGTAAVES